MTRCCVAPQVRDEMRRLAADLPPEKWLGAAPQLISRIAHPHGEVGASAWAHAYDTAKLQHRYAHTHDSAIPKQSAQTQ